MSQVVTFSDISLSKTKAILGQPIDISKNPESDDDSDDEDIGSKSRNASFRHSRGFNRRRSSSLKRVGEECDMMLNQASSFRDFENLFTALDAMEEWVEVTQKGKK